MNQPIIEAMRFLAAFPSFEELMDGLKVELGMKTDKELAAFFDIVPQKLFGRVHKCNGGFMFDMVKKIATK